MKTTAFLRAFSSPCPPVPRRGGRRHRTGWVSALSAAVLLGCAATRTRAQQADAASTPTPTSNSTSGGSASGDTPLTDRIIIDSDSDVGYRSDQAIGATRTSTPVRDLPLTINTLNQQFPRDNNITSAGEAFRYQSGVENFNQQFTTPFAQTYQIRGLDANFFLRDGYLTYYQPTTATIDRVEIIRGASGVVYGQTDPGGVINFVTKKPLFENHIDFEQIFGEWNNYQSTLDITGPVPGTGKTLAVRVIGQYTDRDFRLDREHAGEFTIAPSLLWTPTAKTVVLFQFEYQQRRTTNNNTLGLLRRYANDPAGGSAPGPTVPIDSDRFAPTNLPPTVAPPDLEPTQFSPRQNADPYGENPADGTHANTRLQSLNLSIVQNILEYAGPVERMDLRAVFNSYQSDTDTLGNLIFAPFFANGNGVPVFGTPYRGRDYYYELGFLLDLANRNDTAAFDLNTTVNITKWLKSETLLGYEVAYDRYISPQSVNPKTGVTTDYFFSLADHPRSDGSYDYYSTYNAATGKTTPFHSPFKPNKLFLTDGTHRDALFFTQQFSAFDNRVRLYGSLRYNDIERSDLRFYAADPHNDVVRLYPLVPQAGIVVTPFKPISFYFSYSQSFQYELQNGFTAFGGTPPPVTGEGYDGGIKFDLGSFHHIPVSGTVSVFDLTRSNLPTDDPSIQNRDANGNLINPRVTTTSTTIAFNTQERSKGVEVELFANPVPNWDVTANFTYLDSFYGDNPNTPYRTGKQLPFRSPVQFSLFTKYAFRSLPSETVADPTKEDPKRTRYVTHPNAFSFLDGFFVGAGLTFRSKQTSSYTGYTFQDYRGDKIVIDLFAGYNRKFFGKVDTTFQVNVRNITDEDIYTTDAVPNGQGREVIGSIRLTC